MAEVDTGVAFTPPAGHPRFPLIDSCRALAALSVLLYHVGEIGGGNADGALREVGSNLSIGVPIFFAISGFVLYRPFVNARLAGARRPVIREYVRRRVLRIVPAYWVALTGLALLAGLPGVFSDDFWRYYGFLQIYDNATLGSGLGVAWTLCVEVTFYLLLPVYALGMDRLCGRADPRHAARLETGALLALAVASLAFRQAVGAGHEYAGFPTQTLAGTGFWFVPGMLLAIWTVQAGDGPASIRKLLTPERAAFCWALALGGFLVGAYAHSLGVPHLAGDLLTPLVAFFVLVPATVQRRPVATSWRTLPQWILGRRLLLWLGLISYPIYLYHATLMAWLDAHGAALIFPLNHWIGLAIASVVAAVCAAVSSWYLLERPILRRAKSTRPAHDATRHGLRSLVLPGRAAKRTPEEPALAATASGD